MKPGIIKAFVVIILSLTIFSGCNGNEASKAAGNSHNGLKIVTSFYPVYITAINIAKDISGVDVTNLTGSQTGCLHDYNLKTGEMKLLEDADIFIINGAGMESFMDKVIKQQPDLKIIDSSKDIEFLKDDETGEANPHVWVGISGAMEQAENVGEQLALMDPLNAARYISNTEAYVRKLTLLKNKMNSELVNAKTRDIITFHEAFPYFAKEFNLNIKAVIEREPGSDPEPGELARTVDIVRESGINTLFTEPQYPSKAAEVIARETGAEVYVLDPVVTGEANGDADAYIKTMEANLKTLMEALNR